MKDAPRDFPGPGPHAPAPRDVPGPGPHAPAPRPEDRRRAPRVGPGTVLRLAVLTLFFTAAPTVGDIGSCGRAPDEMDPAKFFSAKDQIDCDKCNACELFSETCQLACERAGTPGDELTDFPRGCRPLVHDGEVCLNALEAAGCGDYRFYMSDFDPTIPTECNFCPPCDDGGLPDGSPTLPRCD